MEGYKRFFKTGKDAKKGGEVIDGEEWKIFERKKIILRIFLKKKKYSRDR